MRITKFISGLLISAMLACALPAAAQIGAPATWYPRQGDMFSIIGSQTIPSNGAIVFTNPIVIPIKANTGIGFYVPVIGGSNGTSNVVFNLGVSPWTNSPASLYNGPTNGPGTTSFFTNALLSFTNTANSTNTTFQYAFLPATSLAGEKLTVVSASTLQTNAVTVPNFYWFYTSQQP